MRTIGKAFLCAAALGVSAPSAAEDTRQALIRALDREAMESLDKRARAVAAISSRRAAEERAAVVRRTFLSLIGGLPARDNPLQARTTGGLAGEGYRVENIVYDSLPGQHVTANLFLPAGAGPFPAVVLSPGHAPSGKGSNYVFAANLARNGIAALSYDIVDEGERLEHINPRTGATFHGRVTGDHSASAFPPILLGEHVARYFINDALRGIDYLASRPEIDIKRIGAFGCSGGGTVTTFIAALDPRVKAAASACYVNDFAHLLPTAGPQEAEQTIPGFIAEGLDLPDLVVAAAPKPYAVISTTDDMFPYAGAAAAVAEARRIWRLYGAEDRLTWITGPGRHGTIEPLGDDIVGFFRRSLAATGPVAAFKPQRPPRPEDALVTPTGQVATSLGGTTLADAARKRLAEVRPARPLQGERLRAAIRSLVNVRATPGGSRGDALVAHKANDGMAGDRVVIESERGPIDIRLVMPPSGSAARTMLLLVPGALADVAKPRGTAEKLAAQGYAVVQMQVRGSDGDEDLKSPIVGTQNLLSLRAMLVGRTLPGIRIDDIIRAIDWIEQAKLPADLTIAAAGIAAPVALQAAVLDSRIDAVTMQDTQLSWRAAVEKGDARDLPAWAVPNLLAHYDIPDLIAALGSRPVTIAGAVDPWGLPLREAEVRKVVGQRPGLMLSAYPALP